MRMYELWKLPKWNGEPARLEDEGGPVLFQRMCDAEEVLWEKGDRWDVNYAIVPVRVGLA